MAGKMGYRQVAELAGGLTSEERARLVEEMRAALAAEIAPDGPGDPGRCPRCGCERVVRRGRDGAGRQRWLCRGCGSSHTSATMGLLSRSRLPAKTWMTYAECVVDGLSLRDAAQRCGVSLRTSFFMRHRVCEVMESMLPAFSSGPGDRVQVDEMSLPASATGNHSRNPSFSMQRRPRRRGGQGDMRGPDGARVVAAVNGRGDELARVAGVSGLTLGQVRAALGGAVAGADVVTDDAPVYRHVLTDELGAASHEAVVSDRGRWGPINAVNALHSRLSAFLAGFGGVSVRRLANYVSWFLWREAARRQDGREGRLSLLRSQVGAGRYKTSWRGLWEVPYPAKMGIVSRVG